MRGKQNREEKRKMTENQEFVMIIKHIRDLAKEMNLSFSKESLPILSISNTLELSKAKSNRYIDMINKNMEILNLQLKTGRIDLDKWERNALAYQILLYSIVDYVKDRELLGWHMTKNFNVR